MLGDRDAQVHDHDVAVWGGDLHGLAEQAMGHRVARGEKAHRRQAIDSPHASAGRSAGSARNSERSTCPSLRAATARCLLKTVRPQPTNDR